MMNRIPSLKFGVQVAALFVAGFKLSAAPLPTESAVLYNLTNIWSIHLKFAPEEWKAMEPKGGPAGFGGGPGRGPGPMGPRGFGGPPGGPGGFGPAMFIAPVFM